MKIVSVDIGGTHVRFATAQIKHGRVVSLSQPVTLATRSFPGLPAAWSAFADMAGPLPKAAAVAVASPITGETIKLTNSHWTIQPDRLGDELRVDDLTLINDFAAVGHAVAQAQDEDFQHVCGPEIPLPAEGMISICGPGTGLGVAALHRGAGDYRVIPSEGGHQGFAPFDSVEDAMLASLRSRIGRVSVERLISGPGIVEIHSTLARLAGRDAATTDDRTVWDLAFEGGDRLAASALDRFCLMLGAFAGDVALVHGAKGVVIGGGLGLRLRSILGTSGFCDRFVAKGRFENHLRALPVKLIIHEQPGLFGAAAAHAARMSRASSSADAGTKTRARLGPEEAFRSTNSNEREMKPHLVGEDLSANNF